MDVTRELTWQDQQWEDRCGMLTGGRVRDYYFSCEKSQKRGAGSHTLLQTFKFTRAIIISIRIMYMDIQFHWLTVKRKKSIRYNWTILFGHPIQLKFIIKWKAPCLWAVYMYCACVYTCIYPKYRTNLYLMWDGRISFHEVSTIFSQSLDNCSRG